MSAIDDFVTLLETTEVMKQVLKSLKEEPAHLLGDICREYQRTGQSMPDHHLQFVGYMGEAALKALLFAGLIRRQPGGRLSLYCYEPTSEGLAQYEKLKADNFYQK
ncbi:MAG TPA: hypothetical protein VMW37_02790 [Dehalococcoidales bacterium]|nr:hypothetical protein [Dehalococcoidales bacterium]